MKGPIRSLWYTNEELQRAESRVLVEMGGLRNPDTSWCAANIEIPRISNSGPSRAPKLAISWYSVVIDPAIIGSKRE